MEATVLNRLSFGQTDLVSCPAFLGAAPAIDFDHQDITRKIEFRSLPGHVASEGPFTADELQVQARDAVSSQNTISHDRHHFKAVEGAYFDKAPALEI